MDSDSFYVKIIRYPCTALPEEREKNRIVRLDLQVYRAIHTKNQRKDVKDETGEHTGLQHGIAVSVR